MHATTRVPSVHLLVAALIVLGCSGEPLRERSIPPSDESLTVAFYNLENLFDTLDDPLIDDDEFTPGGTSRWTSQRLDRKIQALARGLRSIDDYAGPDIIGLCELENSAVVEMLRLELGGEAAYGLVHRDSRDRRGIDVALLYRPRVGLVRSITTHTVPLPAGEDPTRDILQVTFEREGRTFDLLVNHWPSRRGGVSESAPRREAAALVVAAIVDSLERTDQARDVILVGDLNDIVESAAIGEFLDAAPHGSSGLHRMVALARDSDTIGSYRYDGAWETIDHIMLSWRGAYDGRGIVLLDSTETIHAPDFLRDAIADSIARPPYRTYKGGGYYIGGASDHFPVWARVGWRE